VLSVTHECDRQTDRHSRSELRASLRGAAKFIQSYSRMHVHSYRAVCVIDRFQDEKRFPARDISVVVGAHEIMNWEEPSRQRHEVKRVIMHEKYSNITQQYDIMLLQLKSSIKYNDAVKPICVDNSVFKAGTKCYVTGWGTTKGQTLHFLTFFSK